jgi:hypothetical protein
VLSGRGRRKGCVVCQGTTSHRRPPAAGRASLCRVHRDYL